MNESLTLLQTLAQFHFLRPLWLLALLPALFFFSRLWHLDAQGSAWHKVIDQSLLPYLLSANKSTSQRLPLILLIAAWVISALALAGPTWSKQTQPVQERQEALVIVLDLSLGMFANDQDPNRITVARRKIMDLLDTRREGQTGLVVYAGEAHLVTPLTDDSVTIRAMIPALSPNIMPVIGNNPAEAIAMANSLMDDASAVNGRILLITANVPRDQNAEIQDILSHNRYPLHIIGVGSTQGAPIPVSNGEFLRDNSGQMVVSIMDRSNLQALSSSLNGRYSDLSINASDLETVLSDSLLRGDDDSYLESEEEVELWQDAGPWLLILLLPLCALCFRRGWVLQLSMSAGLALTLLPSPPAQAQGQEQAQEQEPTSEDPLATRPNAPTLISEDDLQEMAIGQGQPEATPEPRQGFDIRSLWLNRDQRGLRYLQEGDPYTAASLFEIPEWQGSAAFRAGDYQAAIAAFSQSDDIDSLYNLGNSLAFAERLEEAIAAYERVLAQDPQHADALKNKEIVEDLLEEQQQQEQEQQEQQEQEQQQQQDSQSESDSDDSEQDQQQEQEQQEQQEQSEDQQQSEQENESESENADQGQQRSDAEVEQEEDQESLEQFLRRIEDDPGELLQRKFQFESRRRMIERRTGGQNAQ